MDQFPFLQTTILDNTILQWSISLGLALLAMLVLRLLISFLVRRLERVAQHTVTDLDDLGIDLLQRTKGLLILLVGIWFGSRYLTLTSVADEWIKKILIIGVLIQLALWVNAVVGHFIGRYRKAQEAEDPGLATALGAMGILAQGVVWVIFLLLILQNLGIQITALVTGLGIGGIAIALAVQNVLGDLLASLSIILDKPFVIGDFVVVGEFAGTVEHVGMKTTRVRSLSGEQLVFSNSDLLSSRIRNYKRMAERRIAFSLGVTYDTGHGKLERIPRIIREVVESVELARFDRSHFKGFGDFSLNFETVYYVLVPDYTAYMDTQQTINLEIYRRFEEEGIEFAFPTQTIWMGKED